MINIVHQSEPFAELKKKKGAIGYYVVDTLDSEKAAAYFHARMNAKSTMRKGKIATKSFVCVDKKTGEAPLTLFSIEVLAPFIPAKRGRTSRQV